MQWQGLDADNRSQAQGCAGIRKQILGPGLTPVPPRWYNRSHVLYTSISEMEVGMEIGIAPTLWSHGYQQTEWGVKDETSFSR